LNINWEDGRRPRAAGGGRPRLQRAALGHEQPADLGLLAEVRSLQLLAQAARLTPGALGLAAQPLELARHRRVQEQLARLRRARARSGRAGAGWVVQRL